MLNSLIDIWHSSPCQIIVNVCEPLVLSQYDNQSLICTSIELQNQYRAAFWTMRKNASRAKAEKRCWSEDQHPCSLQRAWSVVHELIGWTWICPVRVYPGWGNWDDQLVRSFFRHCIRTLHTPDHDKSRYSYLISCLIHLEYNWHHIG